MDSDFISLVVEIKERHGESALLDARRLRALLADYTANDHVGERRNFLLALEEGLVARLRKETDVTVVFLKTQASYFATTYSLNENAAERVVWGWAKVLGWQCTPLTTVWVPDVDKADEPPLTTAGLNGPVKNVSKLHAAPPSINAVLSPPTTTSKKKIVRILSAGIVLLLLTGALFVSQNKEIPLVAENSSVSGDSYTNQLGMTFIRISPGTFMMGSGNKNNMSLHDTDASQRIVTISKPFYISKYEVTRIQWAQIMEEGHKANTLMGRDNPIEGVSWDDAQKFITRLNEQTGHIRYRLPTEAEWEYAARAGAASVYPFGDNASDMERHAWYGANASNTTHPVGQKEPNAWGLYDMLGNVREWVQDWYGEDYYHGSPSTDPQGPPSGLFRVNRGGGWYSNAEGCRSAFRSFDSPDHRSGSLGFRLVFSLD